ncbi:hypothetical protein KP509_1Z092100 [Ceratopteris richardii]|nr:hypothetical protein KP509_1Z092100 [Ceratopteris richardii]
MRVSRQMGRVSRQMGVLAQSWASSCSDGRVTTADFYKGCIKDKLWPRRDC